eukprot:15102814-Alexandrium_andersonii.AAC.1
MNGNHKADRAAARAYEGLYARECVVISHLAQRRLAYCKLVRGLQDMFVDILLQASKEAGRPIFAAPGVPKQ